MDVFGLLVIVALGLAIGAILGFVAFGRTNVLRREVAVLRKEIVELTARIEALPEGAAAPRQGVPPPVPEAAEAVAEPVPEVPATPAAPPQAESPAAPVLQPKAARASLEEIAGTRWAVWVGGVALALGAIFLVRYSIEAGLLGPAARVVSGLALAVVLLAAGEWMRRRLPVAMTAREAGAYIPGVLTAAGTIAAFASIYAAYALYGLIGPLLAFAGLGLVGVATLVAAVLHGPVLAGLGLAASYVTPTLVSSDNPSLPPLILYLLAIGIVATFVARLRLWRWLAAVAAIGAIVWAMLMFSFAASGDAPLVAFFVLASFAITHGAFVWTIHPRDPRLEPGRADRLAATLLSGFALPALLLLVLDLHGNLSLTLMMVIAVALFATRSEWTSIKGTAVVGGLLVILGYVAWKGDVTDLLDVTRGGLAAEPSIALATPETSRFLSSGVLFGVVFLALGVTGSLRSTARAELAAVGAAVPIGLFAGAYLRVTQFDTSIAFGMLALLLAALLAALTETMIRRLPAGGFGTDGAVAAYAVGAIAALAGALTIMLDRGWLTIALALICPGIAWVESWRPVRGLRATAVAAAAVVMARFVWDPAVVGADVGTTPVFNWLLYGYGVPALAFAATAEIFRRQREDVFTQIFEALAVFFTLLTAVMDIHHAMTGGDLNQPLTGLTELSLVSLTMLAAALGLQRIARNRRSPVFVTGSTIVGGIGLLSIGLGHLFAKNPLFTGESIGAAALSAKLAFGYLAPAVLAAAVSISAARAGRPVAYVRVAGWLAAALGAAYVTLQVRGFFHRPDMSAGGVTEAELYTYSLVWLICGLAALGLGLVFNSRSFRLASGAVVLLVVIKVFLVDMSDLTGILRALSFIGLGAVLILVGLIYQRLLRRSVAPPAETSPPPPA